MEKPICTLINRGYTTLYDHVFFLLKDEKELEFFHNKHVPVMALPGDFNELVYHVEVSDFMKAIMPDTDFSDIGIYAVPTKEGVSLYLTIRKGQICKQTLSILNEICRDYCIKAYDGHDEDGCPTGCELDIVISLP